MSRSERTRGSRIQEPDDNKFGPMSPSSITAPPSKRRRGRPPKNISTSKPNRPRALRSLAPTDHTATDAVVNNLGKKRKRTLSGDVCSTCLQTVRGGCRRRSYPNGENQEQDLVTICHKCNKERHARKGKPQTLQPAYTDDAEAGVKLDRQAQDTTLETDLGLGTNIVTEKLDTLRITDNYGGLVNFSKITVIQARKAYRGARDLLSEGLTERKTCIERYYKLKSEIEEYRREFHLDSVSPSNGESKHSTSHRLALGITSDKDWTDNISAKIKLFKAKLFSSTERLKPLQDDVREKKGTLERVEQQRSVFSTCLETSCLGFERLQSQLSEDFIEDLRDLDSFSETTMEDSVAEDITPNGIAKFVERLAEGANQQHTMENSKSKDDRGEIRALSWVSETAEVSEFGPPQLPS